MTTDHPGSTRPRPAAPSIRDIVLDGGTAELSALLAEPASADGPRATVVAVHGGGMRAGYFHGQAHPSLSLLTLGARLGYTVLAVDRPGYGLSAAGLPDGQNLAEQAATLLAALAGFAGRHRIGAGFFLLGHSYGGMLALAAAAHENAPALLGVDVSGVSHRYAIDLDGLAGFHGRGTARLHWGPLGLYPPDTFRLSSELVTTMPAAEALDARDWPARYPDLASRVRAPVRFTFAEFERWWRHDDATVESLTGLLSSPRTVVDRLPRAGHNISLGWQARPYHRRALTFLENCLAAGEYGCDAPTAAFGASDPTKAAFRASTL